jgi:hypothetical protein
MILMLFSYFLIGIPNRMAPLPVDVLGAHDGFVATSDVVNGLLGGAIAAAVGANATAVAGIGVAGATGDGAPAAPASAGGAAAGGVGGPRAIRWNNNTSGFVLRRMA